MLLLVFRQKQVRTYCFLTNVAGEISATMNVIHMMTLFVSIGKFLFAYIAKIASDAPGYFVFLRLVKNGKVACVWWVLLFMQLTHVNSPNHDTTDVAKEVSATVNVLYVVTFSSLIMTGF